MHASHLVIALVASLLAGTAFAQTGTAPLNTKLPAPQNDLPPTSLPAASATAPVPASAPGVYYGDTSGAISRPRDELADARRCDDSTYDKPQVHGSVGMGVMSGSHMSGNYQSGAVSVTKNLGSCDDPKGAVNFSIGVGQGHFNGRRW